MIGEDKGPVAVADRRFLESCLIDIRRREAGGEVDAVGAHKGFGEIHVLEALDAHRADDRFRQRLDPAADDIGYEPFLDQLLSVDDAVGHIGRLVVGDKVDQPQGGGARVDEDEIIVADQRRCVSGDSGLFLAHSVGAVGDIGFINAGAAVQRRRSAENLVELAHLGKGVQIAADRGLGDIKLLGKFRYGNGVAVVHDLQNQLISFLCQHIFHPFD